MTIAVVGLQWGDEGKGKVVDYLAEHVDMIVRAQGGNNAGHSVIVGDREYHFHLIPSGILYSHTKCFIGDGTVIDPAALLKEMEQLESGGISFRDRMVISPYAHVIFPYHQLLDQLKESRLRAPIGTTGRGIGPCYADAVARQGIRMAELIKPEVFKRKLQEVLEVKNWELKKLYDHPPCELNQIFESYSVYAETLAPLVTPFGDALDQAIKRGKKVLFEGAQGALLDVTHGSYPFVTSSHTTTAGLALGAGVGPNSIHTSVGVIKAYATRVGNGPFPTEFSEKESAAFLSPVEAREFGTTTGRMRRMGWFDAILARYAIRLNGIESLALTKLDVLSRLDKIRVCVGYELDGEKIESPPIHSGALEQVVPIYETLEGWKEPLGEIKSEQELPKHARIFVNFVEELCGVPISLVSYGPEREKVWKRKPKIL